MKEISLNVLKIFISGQQDSTCSLEKSPSTSSQLLNKAEAFGTICSRILKRRNESKGTSLHIHNIKLHAFPHSNARGFTI